MTQIQLDQSVLQGAKLCAKYAFPPNTLRYCGPDQAKLLSEYKYAQTANFELIELIKGFQVLYPYLSLIASQNNLTNPLDIKVVEAYWLGNPLLLRVHMKSFYDHLLIGQKLKKRLPKKDLEWLLGKIPQGALPHHTFHVLNVFTRTGHHTVDHTLETMDSCRIGWGKVLKPASTVENQKWLIAQTQPLVLVNGKLALGAPVKKNIQLDDKNNPLSIPPKIGQWISFHWNYYCDILTSRQVNNLQKYTLLSLQLANQTL